MDFVLPEGQYLVFYVIFIESVIMHLSKKVKKIIDLSKPSNVLFRVSIRVVSSVLAFNIYKYLNNVDSSLRMTVSYLFIAIFLLNLFHQENKIFNMIDNILN